MEKAGLPRWRRASDRRPRPAAGGGMHFLALATGIVSALLLAGHGCGSEPIGVRPPNEPPRIRITAGPVRDSLHSYRVTFEWTAFDPDGAIAGFEYALNDTTIPDSLHTTAETSVTLHLRMVEEKDGAALDTLAAYHTFHVRANDEEGLWSAFATARFNAFAIAPTTTITLPDPRFYPRVGTTFDVLWSGDDPDGGGAALRYSSRLVWVPPESAGVVDVGRLERPGGGPPWTAFDEITATRFEALPEGAYLFGVRARDEAGAVEPDLLIGRNVVRLRLVAEPGLPTLSLTADGRTVVLPNDEEDEKTFAMISGQYTLFTIEASAAAYAAQIVEIAYGVDLESVDPGDPGWRPLAGNELSLRLDNPPGVEDTLRVLYLKVTDSIGQNLVADAFLTVAPPDLSRDILYVDDIGNDRQGSAAAPTDTDHDQFVMEVLLAEAGRRGLRLDQYEVQRSDGGIIFGAPDLAMLRRYRLLVWGVRSTNTGLQATMAPESPGGPVSEAVAEYMALGGRLWLFGNAALVNLALPPTPNPYGYAPGELGYDVLHLETERDGSQIVAGGILLAGRSILNRRIDGLAGGIPTARARAEGWPELIAVRDPYAGTTEGIPGCEGMTIGYTHGARPGSFDTLYTFYANAQRLVPPAFSRFSGAPCAFRYQGPLGGKILAMAFPMDWWSDAVADSLGQSALRWFFEERAP
jgi:hypothetical protein